MSVDGRAAVDGGRVRFLLAPIAALLALALPAAPAGAPDVIFSALGDVPYDTSEITDLEEHVANHNLYSPSRFLIHLGDILSGSEGCTEARYALIADILGASEVPAFILPGDNEWVNCSDPDQAWAWWTEHLLGLEQGFCGIWPVDAQVSRPENFSFVLDGVLFIGLNKVSGTPSTVTQADAAWIDAGFAAHGAASRAAVLMAQAEPSGAVWDAVLANGRAFGKPLLYLHGDGHEWIEDPAYFGEPNLLRVQVDRGTASAPPVKVTVTSGGIFLFNRNPWPPGTSQVVRPPCGSQPSLSIDDLFVNEGQNAIFTVALSGATGSAVSVDYATQDQSAAAGQDYQARSGSLSFSGTTTTRPVTITGIQDTVAEPGESFVVNLTNPGGAVIARPQGVAVILDDDSAPPPSGSPVLREVVSGGSVNSSAVATSAPVPTASGDLYLAAISAKSHLDVTGVTGLGLAWTAVRQQCGGRAQTGVSLFRAQGSPTASGPVTATLAGTASAAVIHVARYSGAKTTGPIGNVVSGNTLGISGGCSGGVDGAAYAFNLATGAANSLVFVAAGMRSKNHLPGTGWVEIAETFAGSSGSTAGGSVAERVFASAGTASVNGGFDGTTDWAIVAAEVLAASTTPPVTLSVTTTGSGSVTLNPPGGSYASGTTVTLTAVPAAGHAFTGWSGAFTGTANPATLLMDANRSVTASFAPVTQVTLSVTATAGGSVTLNPPGGSYASGTTVTLTAVPAAGHAFTGWSGALTGTANPATLLMDANKSVTANFAPSTQYTLTVTTTTGGSVTRNPPGPSYPSGTVVTLTAVPAAGHAFTGWSGALTGTANPTTLLMNGNQSVTASFSPVTNYTVTVLPATGGSISLSPAGGTYPSGTTVSVTAVPASGYRFGSWGGSLSGTANPTTLLVNGNKTVSATFIRRYTLTTSKTGSGSVTLSPSGGVYDAGTVVTVTAVPSNSVASFLGWGGSLTGTANPQTLVMNADGSVSASFTQTYTLSVSIRRKGSVTLSPPGGVYVAGTTVTLTANPGAGYSFAHWDGALTGSANPATLLINGDASVLASFRKLP